MMASPAEGHDVPKTPPRAESERAEPPSHPEPACQEAQKWIEVSDWPRIRGAGTDRVGI